MEPPTRGRSRRPDRLRDPSARTDRVVAPGRHLLLHEGAQHRLLHDPGVLALEPVVPPAQALLQIADRRPRDGLVPVLVPPRADEPEARHPEVREQPGDGVGVAVHPAAGGEDRALDRGVVLVDRAVLPVAVAALVGEPDGERQRELVQPLLPLPAPVGAGDLRIRRPVKPSEERRAPVEGVVEETPAHVVHVVGVAVVRRAVRDDRGQRGRPQGRDLEGVEPTPGAADHADLARAPGLRRDPRDQLLAVVELLRRVLVVHQPVGIAGAAHVDAEARVAVAGRSSGASDRRRHVSNPACGTAGTSGAPGPGARPPPPGATGAPPSAGRSSRRESRGSRSPGPARAASRRSA